MPWRFIQDDDVMMMGFRVLNQPLKDMSNTEQVFTCPSLSSEKGKGKFVVSILGWCNRLLFIPPPKIDGSPVLIITVIFISFDQAGISPPPGLRFLGILQFPVFTWPFLLTMSYAPTESFFPRSFLQYKNVALLVPIPR